MFPLSGNIHMAPYVCHPRVAMCYVSSREGGEIRIPTLKKGFKWSWHGISHHLWGFSAEKNNKDLLSRWHTLCPVMLLCNVSVGSTQEKE